MQLALSALPRAVSARSSRSDVERGRWSRRSLDAGDVPEGFEPFELDEGRLQPAQLIEDELIVAIPLVPKHARVEDCGSLAREFAELGERP